MNKENKEVVSSSNSNSVQGKLLDKKMKSFSTYSMQGMPHKSIDLNGSKKNSAANSPQNYQPQQQTAALNGSVLKPSNFTTALNQITPSSNNAAGMLQRQFMEQKLKEKQCSSPTDLKSIGQSQTTKNKKGEVSNIFSSFGGTADSGSLQNSSYSNSQSQVVKNTVQKQNSLHVSQQEYEATPGKYNQFQKQNSCATIDDHGGSRRFSVFSKSSFCTSSSFLFGTRIFNKSQKSVPKVNMSTIFKNKANLYLDEALINTVDDLLDKGYEMVASKKEERDILKDQEKAMVAESTALEKEITPLIQRSIQCSEQISHQVEVQRQYEKEISSLQEEVQQLQQSIQNRQNEISNTYDEYTNIIKQMEIENNKIKSDININKACHRQEANNQQQTIKQKQNQQDALSQLLLQLKADYESKKMAQADKLRKMENKQKMYIGILKH